MKMSGKRTKGSNIVALEKSLKSGKKLSLKNMNIQQVRSFYFGLYIEGLRRVVLLQAISIWDGWHNWRVSIKYNIYCNKERMYSHLPVYSHATRCDTMSQLGFIDRIVEIFTTPLGIPPFLGFLRRRVLNFAPSRGRGKAQGE